MIEELCKDLTVEDKGNVIETRLTGKLNTRNGYTALKKYLQAAEKDKHLRFDLQNAPYINSDFVGLMVYSSKQHPHTEIIVTKNSDVYKILDAVGIIKIKGIVTKYV